MKRHIKSILCLILALTVVVSLSACGNKSPDGEMQGKAEENEHPEYLYTADFYPLGSDSKYGLNPLGYLYGGIYCSGYEKNGEREHEGISPRYVGEFDIEECCLYFAGTEGSLKKLSEYKSQAMTEYEDKTNYSDMVHLSKIFLHKDGSLRFIESHSISWYDGDEPADPNTEPDKYYSNLKNASRYFYCTADKEGRVISSTEIRISENEYLNTHGAYIDEDGLCYIPGDSEIIILYPDGSMEKLVDMEDYPSSVYKLNDGRLAVLCYGDGRFFVTLDVENRKTGEQIKAPDFGGEPIIGGGDFDCYYSNGSNFCGYSFESQSETKLFSWLDADINGDCAYECIMDGEGRIYLILADRKGEAQNYSCELAVISKKPYEQVPKKITLSLSGYAVDHEMRDIVAGYNRASDKYRVVFKDYIEYNPEGFYCGSSIDKAEDAEGRMKLITEISAGDMPDILVLKYMPFKQLAAKGMLEDLYPYLDADGEYGREDIVPSALEAMATGDKLYRLSKNFDVYSARALKSLVGDNENLSYKEAMELYSKMPEGSRMADRYTSREEILDLSLANDFDSYVNWETGECSFEKAEFVDFLNYLKLFPTKAEIDSSMNENYIIEDNEDSVLMGKQLFGRADIYSPEDYVYAKAQPGAQVNDAVVITGIPNMSGSGNIMRLSCSCAISSKCENKEAAWDFLKTLLSESAQSRSWGAPTNMRLMEKSLERAMTPNYEKDNNGNIVLDENGNKIKKPYTSYTKPNGEVIEVNELSEKEAREYMDIISSCKTSYDDNSAVKKIIWDESQAFFAGQKTAEDTAKLIQSKVNIFVNEQR